MKVESLIFSIYSLFKQALDLLEKMLQTDPNKRISVESALKHDFFCSENLYSYPNGIGSLIYLTPESNMKKLKRLIIFFPTY